MRILVLAAALVCLNSPGSVAGELTGTLKHIADTGVIQMGFREAEPPMSFLDKSGQPIGYSIDLCNHIAFAVKQKIGRTDIAVEFVPVTAETRFTSIESGSIDILCGATTKTLGRSERVDFTQLTFVTGASLLSLDATKVPDIMSLKGKRVAVVGNTTTIEVLERVLKARLVDAEVVTVSSATEGIAALNKGEVAAFSSDQVVLIGLAVTRQDQQNYYLAKELFSYEPFALAVKRDDASFRLVADRALSQLTRSKQITAIYRKWFGQFSPEIPLLLKALYKIHTTPE